MSSRTQPAFPVLSCQSVRISERTVWTFVEINDGEFTGQGESTLEGHSEAIAKALRSLSSALFEPNAPPSERHFGPIAERLRTASQSGDLIQATALSGVEQALHDLLARRAGISLHARLGESRRSRIRLYANINRGTVPRTPQQFAARAIRAATQGFDAIKMAPFDGVSPEAAGDASQRALIDAGLARVAAVRDALNEAHLDCKLMVDCHWRFNAAQAIQMADELARLKVRWYECPVAEVPEQFGTLRALRSRANQLGMQLAGAETMIGVSGFLPLLQAGLYDVVMPDVKHAGGLTEVLRIAEVAAAHGAACSPHNPTGPICHAHSLHVSAVFNKLPSLEVQFEESTMFFDLADNGLPQFKDGMSALPAGPGLGTRFRFVPFPIKEN
ncbi:MAG: mandelate racemase/muconate lactonizing enzyme family protein [Betaproteobacteria bacterium]|nr:mandelate racemase/muconate lactonizing enzyme family protein [Betaproteobacteria bacterium]